MNDGMFRRSLPGGALLVGERVPGRRSAAVGIWFRVGARDEEPGREGVAHFIEHLAFKGTERRSGPEIAASLERGGGSLEAFTTKETTCFYARVLEEEIALAVDVLSDLVSRPRFDGEDLERERQVVLEELRNVEDNPEDLIGELATRHLWPQDIMGASILGTPESLGALTAGEVAAFHRGHYGAKRTVVSAVGAVDPDRLQDLFSRHLELPQGETPRRRPPRARETYLALHDSELSQLHLSLTTAAPPEGDPRRRPVQLLTEILGGGMSSRLFQAIREDAGLAYSVGSGTEHFEDTGYLTTWLSVSPDRGREALERTFTEMETLRREGITEDELRGAKAQVRGSLVMGLESLTSRMSYHARSAFRTGGPEAPEEELAAFLAVEREEVMGAAEPGLDPDRQNVVALGPVANGSLNVRNFKRVARFEAS
jgi:predicted Zn-dependent peptidase